MQVDTTGLKLADSDMLVVLLKSLPEAVKNYVLHHSSADTYESYRNAAMRWEEQHRLFNDFESTGSAQNHAVPRDLQVAIEKHLEWSEHALVEYRMQWCRKWLRRAKELESDEKQDLAKRPAHVQATTLNKRLLLTQEVLDSVGYEDKDVLDLLRVGLPLAGDIPSSRMFRSATSRAS